MATAPTPHHLIRTNLDEEIKHSRRILDFKENWDGEGSPAYREETWARAVEFTKKLVDLLLIDVPPIEDSPEMLVPEILPGPNGSIDLDWENERFDLLINISVEGNLADFYGDAYCENKVKGQVNIEKPNPGFFTFLLHASHELA